MWLSKQTKQLLAILLLCIIGVVYLQNEDVIKQSKPAAKSQVKPSAFIDGSEIKVYNKAGKAEFILSSQTALFFDKQSSAMIEQPRISLLQGNGDGYTKLTALKGSYDTDTEQLHLTGNVVIELPTTNITDRPIRLSTEELSLDKKTRFISTDQLVTISQGNSQLSSKGLHAWIDDKRIKLLSQVRGRYALEQP